MGSWDSTCFLSNLSIREGDPVVGILVHSNHSYRSLKSLTRPDGLFECLGLPITGSYDSYGCITDPKLDLGGRLLLNFVVANSQRIYSSSHARELEEGLSLTSTLYNYLFRG